jgi:hypothetical protein
VAPGSGVTAHPDRCSGTAQPRSEGALARQPWASLLCEPVKRYLTIAQRKVCAGLVRDELSRLAATHLPRDRRGSCGPAVAGKCHPDLNSDARELRAQPTVEATPPAVGVGTPVTRRPLHRSGRAGLPHPALPLGYGAKPHERVRATDTRRRKPSTNEALHPAPRHASGVAPALQHAAPQPADRAMERRDGWGVHRDPVVVHVTPDNRPQVCPDFRDGQCKRRRSSSLTACSFACHR